MTDTTNDVMVVRLDPESLDDLAHRIAGLVGDQLDPPPQRRPGTAEEGRLLTAAQVAEQWGVDRSWVYDHADQLGARRLGNGKRPRLRFDPAEVAAYLQADAHQRGTDVRRSPGTRSDCAEGLHNRVASELCSSRSPRQRPGAPPARPARHPGRRDRTEQPPAPAQAADRPVRSSTPSPGTPSHPRR